MKDWIERFQNWLLEIIFPRGEKLIHLENLAQNNQLRSLSGGESSGNHFSLFSYQDPLVKELVWQIKYRRHPLLTKEVGTLLYEEILETISDKTFFENCPGITLIPVPMSRKRKRTRGWNQTEEIAKAILINDTTHILNYSGALLNKKEGSLPQTETSSKKERIKNAIGAYTANDPLSVKEKTIIVIDDVKTTGATFQEIERVLRETGASQVLCFSIAH